MSFAQVIDQLARQWRALVKALPGMLDSAAAFVRALPANPWAMAALVAIASVAVTIITIRIWPHERAPSRETLDATGVRRLARRGLSTPDIARRTGLSHDAVATIVRARALPRAARTAPGRKTRPSAA